MRMGHEVTNLTRTVPGCPNEDNWPEGRIIRTPLFAGAIKDPAAVLSRWRELSSVIESLSPDVVYANHHTSLATVRACRMLSIPVAYGCHGWGLLCPLKIRFLRPDDSLCLNERSRGNCLHCYEMLSSKPVGIRAMVRHLGWLIEARRNINRLVEQYDGFQETLESANARIVIAEAWRGFFKSRNTFQVPLGMDTQTFRHVSDGPFRNKYRVDGPYVLVTSRIHNTKGQEWAVRAMEFLPPEIKLVLAGNSSLFNGPRHEQNMHTGRVRGIIEQKGLRERIIFTGFLETTELVQAYSGALAAIVPSVWLDAGPYVTIEAMACECPVVVTRNCGTAALIEDGVEGFVVDRKDPEAIAESVLKIMADRERMGKAACEKVVQACNWEKIAGKIAGVFKSVIGGVSGEKISNA